MTNHINKSFILHLDSLSILEKLSDEQAGKLFNAIYQYQKTGKVIELDFALDLAFTPFLNQFLRDSEKYKKICERRREAGSSGGKQKVANASKSNQKVANLADSDSKNDSDSDSKNENDNKKEINKEKSEEPSSENSSEENVNGLSSGNPQILNNSSEHPEKEESSAKEEKEGAGYGKTKNPKTPLKTQENPQGFEIFWDKYNKKTSKAETKKKFIIALKKVSFEKLMLGLDKYIANRGDDSKYWKNPTTWLNQECWDDEYSIKTTSQNTNIKPEFDLNVWKKY